MIYSVYFNYENLYFSCLTQLFGTIICQLSLYNKIRDEQLFYYELIFVLMGLYYIICIYIVSFSNINFELVDKIINYSIIIPIVTQLTPLITIYRIIETKKFINTFHPLKINKNWVENYINKGKIYGT